ncbi:MAG: DNA alkylation repair protein [Candidatus Fimisoma sp.]|nr:DNA alkylation repair protein [Bacillota bacterium]MDY4747825.1 DNA alkylation repair protein [Candidatus Fimisoma sp.]
MREIEKMLFELQDAEYGDFHSRLVPQLERNRIIGVRTPQLKKLAKKIAKERMVQEFMEELPHYYYEENNLHGFLIGCIASTPREALDMTDSFIPFVDNWATCDSLPAPILSSDRKLLRERIIPWLDSHEVYRVRFAIVAMLKYLIDDEFIKEDLYRLAELDTEEYYINMAIAWYYSFALIKQYDDTVELMEAKILKPWIQNKSIQKAVESFRITDERKEYLKTLKIKGRR